MKRTMGILLALALVATMAAALPASATGDVTKLDFLIVAGNDEMPGWQGIVQAFNEDHPDVQIELEQLPGSWAEYIQKLTTLIAAGSAPDIGRMGVAYMPQFASKGQLLDLTDKAAADLNMADYYESAFEEAKIDGKLFGLPIGVYTMVMYYNKDMFDAAGVAYPGLNWDKAWTIDEWVAVAKQLTSGEGASRNFGYSVNFHPERTAPFLYGAGVDFLSQDKTTCTMNLPEVKSIYQTFHDMIFVDKTAPTPAEAESMDISQLFMSGRLAMMAEGEWMMPSFSSKTDYNWGAAPIPGGKTVNFIDQYVVFADSDQPDQAWEAVKSFIGEKAENIMVDNKLAGIPVNKVVAEARIADLFNPLPAEEKQMVLDSISHSQSMPFTANWAELMDAVTVYTDLIGLDEMTVDEAMENITSELNALLAK